jgi:hypothetical protein
MLAYPSSWLCLDDAVKTSSETEQARMVYLGAMMMMMSFIIPFSASG